jgi:hypothetical protein
LGAADFTVGPGDGYLRSLFGRIWGEDTAVEGLDWVFVGTFLSFVVCACVFVLEFPGLVYVGPWVFSLASFSRRDGDFIAIFLCKIGLDVGIGGFDGTVFGGVVDTYIASTLFLIFCVGIGIARGKIGHTVLDFLGIGVFVVGDLWRDVLFSCGHY